MRPPGPPPPPPLPPISSALTEAELAAAKAKHDQRTRDLRERGWGRPTPYSRHDLFNFAIDRWHMQQGIEPEGNPSNA